MAYSARTSSRGLVCSCLCSLLVNSCFSPGLSPTVEEPPEVVRGLPQDNSVQTSPVGDKSPGSTMTDATPSPEALLAFIARYSQGKAMLTLADRELFLQIPVAPAAASLEEAVLSLGLVQDFVGRQEKANTGFNENAEDINLGATSQSVAELHPQPEVSSLELLTLGKQIDLAQALTRNPYLKTHAFAQLCLQALTLSSTQNQSFVAAVQAAVAANIAASTAAWAELNQQLAASENATPSEGGGSEQGEIAPPLPFGAGVFNNDENSLKEAQTLSDQGKFREAVALLQSLPESSLFKAAAGEKIKEISGLAVQDLRRKAARAFQSAKPLADSKTRTAYLLEAKKHLEEALEQYPDAEQIDTVKQNLRVISASLNL